MYEQYKHILVERRGRVLTLTLNAPPKNPIAPALHGELSRIFIDVNRDKETDVVVLTGAGEAFSAGADLKEVVQRLDDRKRWGEALRESRAILYGMLRLEKPIVARINGDAIGLGATLALFCDFAIATEEARIADTHVRIGLAAGDGGALIWPQLIGYARARHYLLTGDPITGRDAADMGLIARAVPRDKLDEEVDAWVQKLASRATLAISWTKIAINMVLRGDFEGLVEAHQGLETETWLSDDYREAVRAFADKRRPVFTGR